VTICWSMIMFDLRGAVRRGLQMNRREFIVGLGGAATWPFPRLLAAEAQRRVGVLLNSTDPQYQSILAGFREGLATFGWAEGRNLRIDYRLSGGEPSSLVA
jgi:hypothetical protein